MKKRYIYTAMLIIPTIILICLLINIGNKKEDVCMVNSTAITSHVIVIDAGHGKPDEGATGIYGSNEEAINLKIALKLQALVEQSGGIVYLTRSDENGIYSLDSNTTREKKVSDIKNRVEIGNQEDVEAFISIHLNKYPSEIYNGWQTFYQKDNEKSKLLADCIQKNLNNSVSKDNKRSTLVLNNVYIMEHLKKPTVTVECGFLSNEEEAKLLEEDGYQDKLAWGIYIGLQEYFEQIEGT